MSLVLLFAAIVSQSLTQVATGLPCFKPILVNHDLNDSGTCFILIDVQLCDDILISAPVILIPR